MNKKATINIISGMFFLVILFIGMFFIIQLQESYAGQGDLTTFNFSVGTEEGSPRGGEESAVPEIVEELFTSLKSTKIDLTKPKPIILIGSIGLMSFALISRRKKMRNLTILGILGIIFAFTMHKINWEWMKGIFVSIGKITGHPDTLFAGIVISSLAAIIIYSIFRNYKKGDIMKKELGV